MDGAFVTMYPPVRQRALTELLMHRRGRGRAWSRSVSNSTSLPRRCVATSTCWNAGEWDKLVIARRVVAELPEDGVVVLDSGSLTFVCAQAMPRDRALVVVTNNLPAAQFLPTTRICRSSPSPG